MCFQTNKKNNPSDGRPESTETCLSKRAKLVGNWMKFSTSNFLAYPLAVIYSEFFPSARISTKRKLFGRRSKPKTKTEEKKKWCRKKLLNKRVIAKKKKIGLRITRQSCWAKDTLKKGTELPRWGSQFRPGKILSNIWVPEHRIRYWADKNRYYTWSEPKGREGIIPKEIFSPDKKKSGTKQKTITIRNPKAKSVQHPRFPSGHPPQYSAGLTWLNFANQTGYGVFHVVWPYAFFLILCDALLWKRHFLCSAFVPIFSPPSWQALLSVAPHLRVAAEEALRAKN